MLSRFSLKRWQYRHLGIPIYALKDCQLIRSSIDAAKTDKLRVLILFPGMHTIYLVVIDFNNSHSTFLQIGELLDFFHKVILDIRVRKNGALTSLKFLSIYIPYFTIGVIM